MQLPVTEPPRQDSRGISVLIVEDHELVRAGMRRLLEDNSKIARFKEVSSGESAIAEAARAHFDIILMDLGLPGMSGVEASLTLLNHNPDAKIIVVTATMDGSYTQRLVRLGVKGYLTKDCSPDEMSKAIDKVLDGTEYIAPSITQKLFMQGTKEEPDCPFEALTKRERQVCSLLLDGKRNRQIGDALFISEKTVSTHRTRSFVKLGINNTAELARLAIQHGVWNINVL